MTNLTGIEKIKKLISIDQYNILKSILKSLNDSIWRADIVDALSNYTDHKSGHSARIINRLLEVTENATKNSLVFQKLSIDEWFVLAVSALLHDITMSGHPKMKEDVNMIKYFDNQYKIKITYDHYPPVANQYSESQKNEIRKYHPLYAIAKIKNAIQKEDHSLHESLNKIEKKYWDIIYMIIKFHSLHPISDIENCCNITNNVTKRLPFLVALFRFADELDLGVERDNKSAREQGMEVTSQAYWEIDYRISVNILHGNLIEIKFHALEEDIKLHEKLFKKIIENHIEKNDRLITILHKYDLLIRYNKYCDLLQCDEKLSKIEDKIINEWKNQFLYKDIAEIENEKLKLYTENIMHGVEVIKNYMCLKIPALKDKYTILVYKEFRLLKKINSIKCKIHVNNKNGMEHGILNKDSLNLKVYIGVEDKNSNIKIDFDECDFSEISVGEEYYYFNAKLNTKTQKGEESIKFDIEIGDKIIIIYKYEVQCYHYGRELTRKESVFFEEIQCEIMWPSKNKYEFYDFSFNRRDDAGALTRLYAIESYIKKENSTFLVKLHNNSDKFKQIIKTNYSESNAKYNFLQVNFRDWKTHISKNNREIYTYCLKWNFVPFFSEPENYLYMERYVNDGSPSGYTKINNTSKNTTPYSKSKNVKIGRLLFDKKIFDYGTSPNWLSNNEILIHEDYLKNNDLITNVLTRCLEPPTIEVGIPTASSRTIYLNKKRIYVKLQYNQILGRIERYITPESAENSVQISSLLKELFDNHNFSNNIFFLPEFFARVVDLGNDYSPRYWGMIMRDYNPYPVLDNSLEKRMIPAFSLFYEGKEGVSESILKLLYQYRSDRELDFYNFLRDKIIFPIYKLYFEILIKSGLQIEAHSQNVLLLLNIENSYIDVKGAVIRDCESFDKDLDILKKLGLDDKLSHLSTKTFSSEYQFYQRRNSLMFDFRLGEYLISPILKHSEKFLLKNRGIPELVEEIKNYNSKYISQLPDNFFPKGEWWGYKNEPIDRATSSRPWLKGNEKPKYR